MILYKYCSPADVDIFRESRLKVTPPDQFNDPFEFAPRMIEALSPELAASLGADPEVRKRAFEVAVEQRGFPGSFADFENSIAAGAPRTIADSYPEAAAQFRCELLGQISRFLGIVCVSEVWDEILMWAHYTRGHTGFVVGLDIAFLSALPSRKPPMPVDYSAERVLMRPYVNTADPELASTVTALVRRKSDHWKYEREWRQLIYLQECETRQVLENGQIEHFKSIDPKAVHEVIFGCRCDRKELRGLLNDKAFSHVKVRTARLDDRKFTLL